MDADEPLTDDVRKAFLKGKTNYLGITVSAVFAALLFVLAYHLSSAWVDYSYLTRQGKAVFGRIVAKEVAVSERKGGTGGKEGAPVGGELIPKAFRLTYTFTMDGRVFEGVGVIPADAYEAQRSVGEEILILFDEEEPSESCVATSDADYGRIRAVMEQGGDLRKLGIRALHWSGTKWLVVALYIGSVLLVIVTGALCWMPIRARRLLNNAEVVDGEILSVEECGASKGRPGGYRLKVAYTTKAGRRIEGEQFVCAKHLPRLPQSLKEGAKVKVVYDGTKARSFFVYELYLRE